MPMLFMDILEVLGSFLLLFNFMAVRADVTIISMSVLFSILLAGCLVSSHPSTQLCFESSASFRCKTVLCLQFHQNKYIHLAHISKVHCFFVSDFWRHCLLYELGICQFVSLQCNHLMFNSSFV